MITENPLTERQIEVLELLAQGMTHKDVGEALGIAPGTVKNHVAGKGGTGGILKALGAKNIANAVYLATSYGWIPPAGSVTVDIPSPSPAVRILGVAQAIQADVDSMGMGKRG